MEKKYTVRKIAENDIYGIMSLIEQFRKEALDKTMVSFNHSTLMKRIIDSAYRDIPYTMVAIKDGEIVGIISYFVMKSFFDENQIVASEIMWYVNKDHRGTPAGSMLLKAAEEDAVSKGAKVLIMIRGHYLEDTRKERALDILYRRKGYKELETHYIKKLKEK